MIYVKHLTQCGANINQQINLLNCSNSYCVPGAALSTGDKMTSKGRHSSCSHEAYLSHKAGGWQLIPKNKSKEKSGDKKLDDMMLLELRTI